MNKNDIFLQKYIEYSEAHRKFIQDGDYRKANNAYKKLTRLYRKLEKDREMAEPLLGILCGHADPAIKLWAAAHSIGLNFQVDVAVKILEDIAQDDKNGLLGFSADKTLKVWKKNGVLIF